MRVLLVYSNQARDLLPAPPIGLSYVAGATHRAGHDVRVLDLLVNRAIGRCPGIVHAAEEGNSTYERVVDRALCALGVAPPYWRFLPILLRVPPVPALRRRYPLTTAR